MFSLRIFIPAFLLITAILAGVGSWIYLVPYAEREAIDEQAGSLLQMINILQQDVNLMLKYGKLGERNHLLTSITTDTTIEHALIVDLNGNIYYSAHRNEEGLKLHNVILSLSVEESNQLLQKFRSTVIVSEGGKHLYAAAPVSLLDSKSELRVNYNGFLVLNKNISRMIAVEKRSLEESIGFFTVLLFVMVSILWMIFHKAIYSRFTSLIKVTEQIASGDLSTQVSFSGYDEFSRIGKALNSMAQRLEENQRKIIISEERLRQSQEFAGIGIWDLNLETGQSYWSDNVSLLLGYEYPVENPSSEKFMQHVYTDDLAMVNNEFEMSLRERDEYVIEHRIITNDKIIKWISVNAEVVRDSQGKAVRVLGLVIDVTERKEYEYKLQHTIDELHYLKYALDQHSLVTVFDRCGDVIYINDKLSSVTGYQKNEMDISNNIIQSGFSSTSAFAEMWKAISSGNIWHGELSGESKHGRQYWLDTTIIPHISGNGEVDRYIAISADVTDKKIAESQHESLRKRVEFAGRMESIGNLTGGIAHDFNNILAAIMGYTELAISEGCKLDDDSKIIKYLAEVNRAAVRARDLIKQMLAYSRGDHGNREIINPCQLLQDTLQMLRPTIPSSIELGLSESEAGYFVSADPVQLQQLFINLIINARDALPGEKGRIEIGIRKIHYAGTVCSSCHEVFSGEYIEMYVWDSGPGIDRKIRDKIFEPFFTTKKLGEGTGMGLSVVHGVTHGMGGHVIVKSDSDSGTLIGLLFPAATSVDNPGDEQDQLDVPAFEGKGKVLLVDDEESLVGYLEDLLGHFGYDVISFTSSPEAFEHFRKNSSSYDLIITDQSMPEMTGLELAAQVRALAPTMPVILCSGYSNMLQDKTIDELNVDILLNKPFRKEQILAAIRQLMGNKSEPWLVASSQGTHSQE